MKILIIVLFIHLISMITWAEKMNSETQDLVIKKMERVLSAMSESDSSWISSQQRLADLLSERARMRFMQEIETQCDGCKGSKADREKAVKIYETLIKTVNLKEDGLILFQLAHLYKMAGNNEKAQKLFESVLTKKTSSQILTRSRVGLADLLFQKGEFKKAHSLYVLALNDKNLENRPLIIYNKAWCEFNMEKLRLAISTLFNLLSRPEQITRENDDGKTYDAAFHSDLLRDLVIFYSKKTVTEKDINSYEKLIPETKRKEMLLHFATEVNRVGQKKAARIILDKYLQDPSLTQEERMNALITKAQVNYDGGQSAQSTLDFAKAVAAFQDTGCDKSEECLKIQKNMKHYVTEVHRSKKLKPDADLLNSYSIYAKSFPNDRDMLQRGAQVAIDIGNFAAAVQLYRNMSSNSVFSKQEQNEALLSEVSAAEKSNNSLIKKDSYLYYIKNSSNEDKKFEVRYQLAYLSYQQKQFHDATEAFYELARESKGKSDLRKKSADLSLDSLAILKDDVAFEARAWEYAQIFPKHAKEFETLARKSLMNQVALVANNKESSTSDLKKYLNKTLEAKLSGATSQEKILLFTNAGVLALKIDDQQTYLKTQLTLLKQPGLDSSKKQNIYEALASYYEKHLDFKQAYSWALKIKNSKLSEKEKQFRLGTLADLANQNPKPHYLNALKAGLKDARSFVIRSRMIALSSNPIAELKRQASDLKRQPHILNDMVLFVYAKTGNKQALNSLVNSKELRNRSAFRFLTSQRVYDRIDRQRKKLAHSRLKSYAPQALQRGTTERVKLLNQADGLLSESLKLKDIVAQMMVLDLIALENERLVKDLSLIPQPKGLTKSQMAQYETLVKAKLRPFLYKAKLAEQKRQEIWNKSSTLSTMISDYAQARPEIQKLMNKQLVLLTHVSGDGPLKYKLKNVLSTSNVSPQDLISARRSVSENPEDKRQIENLKILETKMGHPLMPAYLEARLSQLQRGNRL